MNMLIPRIIPVLLYNSVGLVKSRKFKEHRYIGDPLNAVRIFNEKRVDEIIIFDIEASSKRVAIDLGLVREVAEETNMPIGIGGGISTLNQIHQILQNGAEKVVINSAALRDRKFIGQASKTFGSSTIAVCVDVKRDWWGRYRVYCHQTKRLTAFSFDEYVSDIEQCGAGEIIIQSVDEDGEMNGYAQDLYQKISRDIPVPILALGGAGTVEHMKELWKSSCVNSFCAGSMFVYWGANRGVLINYPEINRDDFKKNDV